MAKQGMDGQGMDGWAIRYAVRIARRLELSEHEIRSLVHTAMGLDAPREDVPVGAWVLAVVRNFQTLIMTGRDPEEALRHIKWRSGTHFHPKVVGTLLTIIREDSMAALRLGRSAVHQHAATA